MQDMVTAIQATVAIRVIATATMDIILMVLISVIIDIKI